MLMQKITHYLDQAYITYQSDHHPPGYTAQHVAELSKTSGMCFAKTVIITADTRLVMIVMPAPYTIDFDNIAYSIGARYVNLAYEHQFSGLFPDCEVGAMPPFGHLFNIPVYISEALVQQKEISFNAGDHCETIRMKAEDLISLVQPTIISCGFHKAGSGYHHEHVRQGKLRH
ncbi:aminoacyl-tRNA deacylase [Moritella sp. 24]|uniref:aminoacyl-tRNA deacylase n=1 Tax=Moritella sp. 24 TaxID=2746230 RepID=UPI0021074535|nr:YbaK/EbsC family protein [Moritella sp. 24]